MADVLVSASNEDLSSIHKHVTIATTTVDYRDDDEDDLYDYDDDLPHTDSLDGERQQRQQNSADYHKHKLEMERLNLKTTDDEDELEAAESRLHDGENKSERALNNTELNRNTIISNVDSSYYHNEIDLKELEEDSNGNKNDTINENEDDDRHTSNDNKEINNFIQEAVRFGANALDLSKKELHAVPKLLFKLDILQYLYLESNMLTELPPNFFAIFVNLKWLDLRNNQIAHLPLKGLANHENLRYLLLENNQIKRLPVDLAYVPNLTALNLINNPLEFPPIDIVTKGIKQVKDFLRANCTHRSDDFLKALVKSEEPNITTVNDDLWASDDDESKRGTRTKQERARSSSRMQSQLLPVRTKSTISYTGKRQPSEASEQTTLDKLPDKLLITQPLQPSNEANADIKSRLHRAKSDANSLSKNVQRKRMLVPFDQKKTEDYAVYKNHALEKALKTGKVDKYKKFKEKTDSQLQKIKDHQYVEDFRDEMKEEQRKLQYKRLIKGVDYEEPVNRAPFDVDENYIMIMSKEERERLDKRLMMERMRSLSPETLWRIEDERRQRDHALQDKIREYTKKLLDRRDAPKGAPRKDRIEAAKDLKELRTLEKELQQRQREIQFGFNAYSGDLRYRETAKLNNAAKASNFLPHTNKYK